MHEATQHAHRFGWCSDGHHRQCRPAYTSANGVQYACSCPCHALTPEGTRHV